MLRRLLALGPRRLATAVLVVVVAHVAARELARVDVTVSALTIALLAVWAVLFTAGFVLLLTYGVNADTCDDQDVPKSTDCQPPLTVFAAIKGDPERRVGTRERDVVLDRLAERYAGGYLDDAELDERQDEATQANTRGDLAHALRDLY